MYHTPTVEPTRLDQILGRRVRGQASKPTFLLLFSEAQQKSRPARQGMEGVFDWRLPFLFAFH